MRRGCGYESALAAWQFQLQKHAGAFQIDAATADDLAALLHRKHGGAIDAVPKFDGGGMSRAPLMF